MERQEIPNIKVAIHFIMACPKERTACQEATRANPEKMEAIDRATAIWEHDNHDEN